MIGSLAELADALNKYEKRLLNLTPKPRLIKCMKRISLRWQGEAQKRVPVDNGTLRQSIIPRPVGEQGKFITGGIGSNVHYAPHIEFGTKWIAGGAVKALGLGPHITDAQAIKSWPAKDKDALSGNTEQMPFIRPSWIFIRNWAVNEVRIELNNTLKELAK